MRAREILAKRVPVYLLILAVVLTALITFSVFAFYDQIPPVREVIKALRPKVVTLTIADVKFGSVTLVDTERDGRANEATVVFYVDRPVDGKVRVTVTLKDAREAELDSGYTEVPAEDADVFIVTVPLRNRAGMAHVKLIEVKFEQVTE